MKTGGGRRPITSECVGLFDDVMRQRPLPGPSGPDENRRGPAAPVSRSLNHLRVPVGTHAGHQTNTCTMSLGCVVGVCWIVRLQCNRARLHASLPGRAFKWDAKHGGHRPPPMTTEPSGLPSNRAPIRTTDTNGSGRGVNRLEVAENAFTARSSELNFCPGSSHRKAVSPIVPATPMMLILLSR